MLTEIKNIKNDQKVEYLVEVLSSRQMETDLFSPLWLATQNDNKEMFELLLKGMVDLNRMEIEYTSYNDQLGEDYSQIAEVLFAKFDYRSAKRKFGKEYCDSLYKKLEIEF